VGLRELIYSGFDARQSRRILAEIAAAGGGGGGGGGGGLLGVRRAQAAAPAQTEVTTGNGSGNPYTRIAFANWTFANVDTQGKVPNLSLVQQDGAFGFDVTTEGIYQIVLEVGYTFASGDAPAAVHWYVDTYNEYFEFMSTPTPGWGAAVGDGGAVETFVTPPFYEQAWTVSDGTYYLGVRADWREVGKTMGSTFGGGAPNVHARIFRLA